MNVSVALPAALPTPPGGGRGLAQAEPSRAGSPFAGLLGEQRLALARAGHAHPDRKTADSAGDNDPAPTRVEPAAAPAAAEARPADRPAASDEATAGDSRPEAAPMLNWFAGWQPEPAPARGLGDGAATASGDPAPVDIDRLPIASEDGAPGPARRTGATDFAPDALTEARARLALRSASREAAQAKDDIGDADRSTEALHAAAMRSQRDPLPANDMTPARAELPVVEARADARSSAEAPATPHAALVALPGPAPAAAGSAAPVFTLATPLAAPDFAQALAAQLTTLARDGVHEAQLQLNPAEMGPIAVQIVVDGSQAQVDFAATQAATRQALEASLPSLAAALQSLGLTLSGGGVFEQGSAARDDRPGEPAARGPRRVGGTDASAGGAQPVALRARAGLLDLYA